MLTFKQFCEGHTGSYVAVKFSDKTLDVLQGLQKKLGLKNPVPRDKLHATLIYSRVPLLAYEPLGAIDETFEPTVQGHYIKDDCYVLLIESGWMRKRHEILLTKHQGTHDYVPYTPHVTLSYDDPGVEEQKLILPVSEIAVEYYEDLDLDWKEKL